jgi:callose synthase
MSFSLWIISATWMWAPFFFNPSGLDWDKVIEDYNDWQNWLRTNNDSAESWFGWWSNEQEYLEHSTRGAIFVTMLRKSRFLVLAIMIYLQLAYNVYFAKREETIKKEDDVTTYVLAGAIIVFFVLMVVCGYIGSRVLKKMSMKQRKLRKMKFVLTCCVLLLVLLSLTVLTILNVFEVVIVLLVAAYWVMEMCILRHQCHHVVIRAMARFYDCAVGWIVFGPILFMAMFLPFLSSFQQRIMFNNAFTSGVEVSKLFSHDVANTQVVKIKRVRKKKRDD